MTRVTAHTSRGNSRAFIRDCAGSLPVALEPFRADLAALFSTELNTTVDANG